MLTYTLLEIAKQIPSIAFKNKSYYIIFIYFLFLIAYHFCCAFYNLSCCDTTNFSLGESVKCYSVLL